MLNKSKVYEQNGIFLSKQKMSLGDEVVVGYNGLLSTSGARQVYMHVGYGDEWQDCDDIPMIFSDGMFKAKIVMKREGQLGIVFRDPADNWDNNSGQNYTFSVAKRVSKVKKEKVTKAKEVKSKTVKSKTVKAKEVKAKKVSKK